MRETVLAIIYYCLGITAGASRSHLRASVRNVRKDPESVIKLCMQTRRKGPQTLIIEGQEEERRQVVQLIGDLATLGACDHHVKPLNRKQKKMIEVCLQPEGERITALIPRTTRSEFTMLGADLGPCQASFSWIEIKLVEDDIEDISASADISGTWRAEQVRMESSLAPPLKGSPITIMFDEDAVSGSAGCNRIFGRSSKETKLDDSDQIIHLVNISGLASTRMYCHPAPIMKQESNFMKLIGRKTFSYKIMTDDRLKLYEILVRDLGGKVIEGELVAVFKRISGSNV
eukprot:scaffold1527_cov145-Skeletonema_menzelii.AAC.8